MRIPEQITNSVLATSLLFPGAAETTRPANIFTDFQTRTQQELQVTQKEISAPEPVPQNEIKNYQPREPYYLWIAYPWTENMKHDGVWRYWDDNGNNPPDTWINNTMPMYDPEGSVSPEDNLYSGQDEQTYLWYADLSIRAHIPIIVFSNWGADHRTNNALKKAAQFYASDKNPYPLLRIAPYIEIAQDPANTPSVDVFVASIQNIQSYAENPETSWVFWRDPNDGKLIIPFYGRGEYGMDYLRNLAEAARITDVHEIARPPSFMNEKAFIEGITQEDLPYGIAPYAPFSPVVKNELDGLTAEAVSPGFDPSWDSDPRVQPRNPQRFDADIKSMVENPAQINIIETLDEWGERTAVAPSWTVKFTQDGPVIDPANSWGYTYIDILGHRLPPLPVIVPDPSSE